MFLKTFALTIMFGLVAFAYAASAPVGSDSIKGEWAGAFSIAGKTATATVIAVATDQDGHVASSAPMTVQVIVRGG